VIPSACFEGNAGASVCLPEEDGNGDGGADGGGGGGGPARLKSAVTLLQGDWMNTGCVGCSVLDLSPGSLTHAPVEAPTSGMAPIVLYNGTTFASGIQLACEAPSTDEVSLATLDISLAELCDLIPSCAYADDLSVTLTAREGSQLVAQGSLTKTGGVVSTTDEGAALGLGDHLLDLCLTESSSGLQFCGSQPVRVSAPLGSGADTFGHFAGEVAGDFIALSGRPGAQALTVGDNGAATVSLPSGFTFDFYAEGPVSVLTVGANGGIRIGTGTITSANTTLPSSPNTQAPNIAVYWDDLDPSASGEVLTWFDGQRFIVSWEGVAHGRDAGSSIGDISVQAHLYEDGRVEFHYADTEIGLSAYDKGRSATIGIQNSARTDAVLVSFNNNTLLGGGTTGLRFETGDCFGSNLEIPPEVGCFAEDLFTTACVPSGGMVSIPDPDVSECAPEGGLVVGTVIESGQTEAQLKALRTPKSIVGGEVQLNAGAHLIQYRVVDSAGVDLAPYFYRLVLVEGWAHSDCGGSGRTLSILSSGDDTYDSSATPEAVCVMGKEGDDFVASGPSSDFLVGGLDAGVCEGNDGDDFLLGEAGDDTLDGGNGNDQIWGGVGDDLLLGANGNDTLECEGGNDIATGGNGDDIVWGGSGDDVLDGDGGDDVIYPGSGVDIVDGGAGDDTIVVLHECELTPGKNLSGGEGTDELVLPEGMTLQDVVAAGVTVNADIESVTTSDSLPTYRTECG
jgi:Ca2+-binding RTX toxin-like protein